MTLLDERTELDELGGRRYRSVLNIAPVAFRDTGVLKWIAPDWLDSGILGRPHIVSAAPFIVSVSNDGLRRIHPKRDLSRYIELGPPLVKPALTWQPVGFSNPTRLGNVTKWSRTQADLEITHGGHFIKLEMPLKGGYVPPNSQFACQVDLVGLTQQGNLLYADGVPVMRLRKPVVYDRANRIDVRPIAYEFVQLGGNNYILFTLPSLAGMTQPVIDPTLNTYDSSIWADDGCIDQANADTVMPYSNYAHYYSSGRFLRSVLKWDLSSLAGATITSATGYLYNNSTGVRPEQEFRRILSPNTWVEAEATWNSRSTGNAWAGSAGCSTLGTDISNTQMGTFAYAASSLDGEERSSVLDTTEFAAMVAANYGVLYRATNETDILAGAPQRDSEDATTAYRPKLVVVYETVSSYVPRHGFIHHNNPGIA